MERLATVGDLVKFKRSSIPAAGYQPMSVYLVSEQWGGFVRLHGRLGMVARDNFEIISEVPRKN